MAEAPIHGAGSPSPADAGGPHAKTRILPLIITSVTSIVVALIGAWNFADHKSEAATKTANSASEKAAAAERKADDAGAEVQNVKNLIRQIPTKNSIRIGDTTWISSYVVPITGSVSDNVFVPKSFVGMVIVRGPGPANEKIFHVGSDAQGKFSGPGGFLQAYGVTSGATAISPESVGDGAWRFINIPDPHLYGPQHLDVALIGVAQSEQ